MTQIADWIVETCSTQGTGTITVTGQIDLSRSRVRDGIGIGDMYYSLLNGSNRETGIGYFNGVDTIDRHTPQVTIVNGIVDNRDPVAIDLIGDTVVSVTFTADAYYRFKDQISDLKVQVEQNTTDIANIGGSNLGPRVTQNEIDIATNVVNIATNVTSIAQNALDIEAREAGITSVENGGVLTQNGSTAIQISAGSGEIIDSYTDPENLTIEDVTWSLLDFDLIANAGMPVVTGYGRTDIGIITGGVVKAYPGGMSNSQRRIAISLGYVEYIDQVIDTVRTSPVTSNQVGNILLDYIWYQGYEAGLQGFLCRPTTIGDLSFWRDEGTLFVPGISTLTSKSDPNILNAVAAGSVGAGVTFTPVLYNNGSTITQPDTLQIDNLQFESGGGGSLTNIANAKAVIHYIAQTISGHFFVFYAQNEYADYATAVSNLAGDQALFKFPSEASNMVLLAQAVVVKSAVTWDDIAASIFPINISGSSSAGAGTSVNAIDVSYTDTYTIGDNVQVAIDFLAGLKLTTDQHAAINASNNPTSLNAYATLVDLTDLNITRYKLSTYDFGSLSSGTINPDFDTQSNLFRMTLTGAGVTINAPAAVLVNDESIEGSFNVIGGDVNAPIWGSGWDFGSAGEPTLTANSLIGYYRVAGDAVTKAWHYGGFS